nr:LINE-type retrotransposon LIb DNA [Ipomoea batatas]
MTLAELIQFILILYFNFWVDRWVGNKPLSATFTGPNGGSGDLIKVCDFIDAQRCWNKTELERALPSTVVELIRATPISINPNQEDKLFWPHSESGIVTVSSAFSCIAGTPDGETSHAWI